MVPGSATRPPYSSLIKAETIPTGKLKKAYIPAVPAEEKLLNKDFSDYISRSKDSKFSGFMHEFSKQIHAADEKVVIEDAWKDHTKNAMTQLDAFDKHIVELRAAEVFRPECRISENDRFMLRMQYRRAHELLDRSFTLRDRVERFDHEIRRVASGGTIYKFAPLSTNTTMHYLEYEPHRLQRTNPRGSVHLARMGQLADTAINVNHIGRELKRIERRGKLFKTRKAMSQFQILIDSASKDFPEPLDLAENIAERLHKKLSYWDFKSFEREQLQRALHEKRMSILAESHLGNSPHARESFVASETNLHRQLTYRMPHTAADVSDLSSEVG